MMGYDGINSIVDSYGISEQALYENIRKYKCSFKDGIRLALKDMKSTSWIYDGIRYDGPKDMCEMYGLSVRDVWDRASLDGCSFEQAFGLTLKEKGKSKYEYMGKKFDSIEDLCSHYRVSMKNLRAYQEIHNCSEIEAFKMIMVFGGRVIYKGKEYESVTYMCKTLNIDYNSLNGYRSKHKIRSIEDALYIFMEQYNIYEDKKAEIKGRKFNNYKEAYDYFKVTPLTSIKNKRMLNDLGIEQFILGLLVEKYKLEDAGDGLYTAICPCCCRKIFLDEHEIWEFEHSNEFCTSHEWS